MELIRGITNLKSEHRPSVVSIGNYDGVHLGHQQVITSLLQQSTVLNAPSTVITFAPLAKEFFNASSVTRLNPLEQRVDQLFKLGVDRVLCIDFNAEFAAYSPKKFVQEVLLDGLGVVYLCVGDDFRFGKDRAGDFNFLEGYGAQHGFTVIAHDTYTLNGERVSSGRVRGALQQGDFNLAEQLLGRPYSISGQVVRGQQLGRTLNYPTANILLEDVPFAISGVYAVHAILENGEIYNGVANLGNRPTVDGSENRLEAHLFNFDDDIYDQNLVVRFLKKIRSEKKFASLDALKAQIKLDAEMARSILHYPN